MLTLRLHIFISSGGKLALLEMIPGEGVVQTFYLHPPSLPCSFCHPKPLRFLSPVAKSPHLFHKSRTRVWGACRGFVPIACFPAPLAFKFLLLTPSWAAGGGRARESSHRVVQLPVLSYQCPAARQREQCGGKGKFLHWELLCERASDQVEPSLWKMWEPFPFTTSPDL